MLAAAPIEDGTARHGKGAGDAGDAGSNRSTFTLGVAGDAANGHVDPVAGGGAVLFGLSTPEPVLALLACPVAAREDDLARVADRAGARFAQYPGLRAFAGGGEEEVGLARARGVARPGEGTGEDEIGQRVGGHRAHSECLGRMRCSPFGSRQGGVRLRERSAVPMVDQGAESVQQLEVIVTIW